jgi:sugar transferase (PEP-CTERM/EpsH1 system associated)
MVKHCFGAHNRNGFRVMSRNILFLCHRLPYPPNKGDKIRSYALLRHLASRGKVNLACFIDDTEDLQHLDKVGALAGGDCHFETLNSVTRIWRSACALLTGKAITTACFGSTDLQHWVNRTLRNAPFDDVVIFGSAMAQYLLNADFPRNRVMFDMVDVDSDKWKQYAVSSKGLLGWIYRREARTLEHLEREAADAFGRTLLVSPFEAETFRLIAPASATKIGSLTNGVDLQTFSPGSFPNPFPPGEPSIVMTGRMDYRPNYEGAAWFATEILPHILKSLPNARVYFVGARPPRALQNIAGPNVVVTGSVADIRPYIQFAKAVIAPLRIARGVQNKVLEAMAMGKPLVATREATRSLAVEPGNQLWVANDPADFAAAVLAALQSSERDKIAQRGYRYVERHHNWPNLLADFDLQLDKLQQPDFVKHEGLASREQANPQAHAIRAGTGQ